MSCRWMMTLSLGGLVGFVLGCADLDDAALQGAVLGAAAQGAGAAAQGAGATARGAGAAAQGAEAVPTGDPACAKLHRGCKDEGCPEVTVPAGRLEGSALPLEDSPLKGDPDAEVIVVISSEFECPYCARFAPTLRRIWETCGDRVSIVYKHNPLPFHEKALGAAVAAEAAHRQGKFWEMYELLFANPGELDHEGYLRRRVERDQALVRSVGGKAVPTLWINGQRVVGAQPFEKLQEIIDRELRVQ